ncbi:hypothetical protein WA556_003312 [Blastocystis sp. ATCC 50177/Nand II]
MPYRFAVFLCLWGFVALINLTLNRLSDLFVLLTSSVIAVTVPPPSETASPTHSTLLSDASNSISYPSPYDVYSDNMTDYERILYVQRNYHRFDTEERRRRLSLIVDGLNRNGNHQPREVVFQEMMETGLGNSLLALASSFMVSQLLNASFHVNWRMYHSAFDSPLTNLSSTVGYKTTLPSYSRWKIRWSGCSPKLSALESEPLPALAPEPNLVITAYFDYTKHLFLTPRYDAQLQSLGLAPFFSSPHARLQRTFFAEFPLMTAVRLFFVPKLPLQALIDQTLRQAQSFHLIGLQVRMGSGGADFRDSHRFLRMAALRSFVQLAENYRVARGIPEDGVKWFLSTDSSEVERNLTATYPGRVVVASGFGRGHSSSEFANRNAFYRAVIDVGVLSRCEYMVLTNHSSFGMIARMLAPAPLFSIVPAMGYYTCLLQARE